jgi:predicted DNA-binding antitoxin AbrB/MazE fold protein
MPKVEHPEDKPAVAAPREVLELVARFEQQLDAYKSGQYNEAQLRQEFLNPLFKALGWDIHNEQGYAEAYKDVIHEDAIRIGGAVKAPDYCFRIGGTRKFFLEAKKREVQLPDGQPFQQELPWEVLPMRKVTLKNGEEVEVVEIALQTMCLPPMSAEDRAKKGFEGLQKEGSYRPRRYSFERVPSCFKKDSGKEPVE